MVGVSGAAFGRLIEADTPSGNGDIKKALYLLGAGGLGWIPAGLARRTAERQHDLIHESGLVRRVRFAIIAEALGELLLEGDISVARGWNGAQMIPEDQVSAHLVRVIVDVEMVGAPKSRRQSFHQIELGLVGIVAPEAVAGRLQCRDL